MKVKKKNFFKQNGEKWQKMAGPMIRNFESFFVPACRIIMGRCRFGWQCPSLEL